MIHIIALNDAIHLGDDDNANAVVDCLTRKFSPLQSVEQRALHHQYATELFNEIAQHPHESYILVGAGPQHIPCLKSLSDLPNVTAVWSGHQRDASLDNEALDALDSIILPNHEISHLMKVKYADKLAPVAHGVPNSKTPSTFLEAYRQAMANGCDLPDAPHYITVVLSGDALDRDGHIRHYTPEEAFALGRWIGLQAQSSGATVLATNSWRTGLYDSQTAQKQDHLHHDGAALDKISTAFLEGMQYSGLPAQQQRFYNFTYESPSMFDAIMGASLTHHGSYVFMPGESSTMISQAVESLPPGQTVSYQTQAMNAVHDRDNQLLVDQGLLHRIDPIQLKMKTADHLATTTPKRAAEAAAEQVFQQVQHKFYAVGQQIMPSLTR